jgi:hypothetical protein
MPKHPTPFYLAAKLELAKKEKVGNGCGNMCAGDDERCSVILSDEFNRCLFFLFLDDSASDEEDLVLLLGGITIFPVN